MSVLVIFKRQSIYRDDLSDVMVEQINKDIINSTT
jgi:hypothetical protein